MVYLRWYKRQKVLISVEGPEVAQQTNADREFLQVIDADIQL